MDTDYVDLFIENFDLYSRIEKLIPVGTI